MDALQECLLSHKEFNNLRVGDKLDHRNEYGIFLQAIVLGKGRDNVFITYQNYDDKWSKLVNYNCNRFAKYRSISIRPATSIWARSIKVTDFVSFRPFINGHNHKWSKAQIVKIDDHCGHVLVAYCSNNRLQNIWTHLDNALEIAPLQQQNAVNNTIYSTNQSIIKPIINNNHSKLIKKQKPIQSHHYPVWPLVIPNNCIYDKKTGKMIINHDKQRNKLMLYQPAMDFIRKISSKIATISIVGRARTGKSLIAGEIYASGRIPCPFDLGHKMDACTYGIWVSAKTIQHPHQQDTVILIFDVEGTGFHQATKHNDMQLMVITLLISSYFIYNSKASFTASCLDEIDFITQLTEKIHAAPTDDSGQEFKKFFPRFMWLLRDVHLDSSINGKSVSVREYFIHKVLKPTIGINLKNKSRQHLREMFMGIFEGYDAFALPIPHANKDMLKNLGTIQRSRLEEEFNIKLAKLREIIMKDTKCKVLFSKTENGEDQYTQCTGSYLAEWIKQCVESVNDPNKIPQITSMTAVVMANVYKASKQNAIQQYQQLLNNSLKQLRNNNDKQPLEEEDIINLHIKVLNTVLTESTLQPQKVGVYDDEKVNTNNQINEEQVKVFKEFLYEIGHDDDKKNIGKEGIMYIILTHNMELSRRNCTQFLNNYLKLHIFPMLEEIKKYEIRNIMDKFEELEIVYLSHCKGPAKYECWSNFENNEKIEIVEGFKKYKMLNIEIVNKEQETASQMEIQRLLKQQYDDEKKINNEQTKLMQDELKRMENMRKSEMEQHQYRLLQTEQKMNDLQESHCIQKKELIKENKKRLNELNKQLSKMRKQNEDKIENMKNKLNELQNEQQKPREQVVVHRDDPIKNIGNNVVKEVSNGGKKVVKEVNRVFGGLF